VAALEKHHVVHRHQRVPMIRPKTPRRSPEKGCGGTKDRVLGG
jgi:hypothetical protein